MRLWGLGFGVFAGCKLLYILFICLFLLYWGSESMSCVVDFVMCISVYLYMYSTVEKWG